MKPKCLEAAAMMTVCTIGMRVIRKTPEVSQAEDQQELEVHKTVFWEGVPEVRVEEVEAPLSTIEVHSEGVPEVQVLEATASTIEVQSEGVPEVEAIKS